ncbi:hypothetical protein K0M31_013015 [Melipona bicolor]|uniref:Uncharacterized protein n=1 Tax=Melipona bicolor TaxID=60889 RepID=A0AA40FI93_9HYME|nr:hypothetical protein K0M31_013015 [Melipona bicolor]
MSERVGRPAKQQLRHPVKGSRSLAKSSAVIPLEISKLLGKFRRIRFSDKADFAPSTSVLPRTTFDESSLASGIKESHLRNRDHHPVILIFSTITD